MSDEVLSGALESGAEPATQAVTSPTPAPPLPGCASAAFHDALRSASAWLDAHVDLINSLNVFPVPDGDTGTNMSLTMRAALAELDSRPHETVSQVARVVSEGALMGARGNSGVILSQVLRGMARALDGTKELAAPDLARAFSEGVTTAYRGVMKPVEGTMLTVAREAAESAQQAAEAGASLRDTLDQALVGAQASLERTPRLLPVLAEAGVVDAGGQGLVALLEGASRYAHGEAVDVAPAAGTAVVRARTVSGETYNYDVQFIIKGTSLNVPAIREQIARMGDSVLVVGDAQTVKVHVHSDRPGDAIDYGVSQGQLTAVIIENMQLQYEEFTAGQAAERPGAEEPAPALPAQSPAISIVAVASGDGLCRVLKSIGASAIVPGGQTMNPSTQDLVSAVERVPGYEVVLLPNNANILLAARQAQQLTAKRVGIVPTCTVPQGIAALLAFSFQANLDENVARMTAAAESVETIEVTRAVRCAQVNGLAVREGQIIGLLNGDLVTAGESADEVLADLLERAGAAEREMVTIYYGEGVGADEAEALGQALQARYANLEIEVLDGGQAYYQYTISVE